MAQLPLNPSQPFRFRADALKNRFPAFSTNIDEARKAGFNDDEIMQEFRGRISRATKAGFSIEEINEEFGVAEEQPSFGGVARTAVSDVGRFLTGGGIRSEMQEEILAGGGRGIRALDVPRQTVLNVARQQIESPGIRGLGEQLANVPSAFQTAIDQVTDPSQAVSGEEIVQEQFPEFSKRSDVASQAGQVALSTLLNLADPLLLVGGGRGRQGIDKLISGTPEQLAQTGAQRLTTGASELAERGIAVTGGEARALPRGPLTQTAAASAQVLKTPSARALEVEQQIAQRELLAGRSQEEIQRLLAQNRLTAQRAEVANRQLQAAPPTSAASAARLAKDLQAQENELAANLAKQLSRGQDIVEPVAGEKLLTAAPEIVEEVSDTLNIAAKNIEPQVGEIVRFNNKNAVIKSIEGDKIILRQGKTIAGKEKLFFTTKDGLRRSATRAATSEPVVKAGQLTEEGPAFKNSLDSGKPEGVARASLDVPTSDPNLVKASEELMGFHVSNDLPGLSNLMTDSVLARLLKIDKGFEKRLMPTVTPETEKILRQITSAPSPGRIAAAEAKIAQLNQQRAAIPSGRGLTDEFNRMGETIRAAEAELADLRKAGAGMPNVNIATLRGPQGIPQGLVAMSSFRPTWRVASAYERETGIRTFSELYLNGRRASKQNLDFINGVEPAIQDIFGKNYGFTRPKREFNDRVTGILENIQGVRPNGNVVFRTGAGETISIEAPLATMAQRMGVGLDEARTAVQLRQFYDTFARSGRFIDGDRYLQFYSPRLSPTAPGERFKLFRAFTSDEQVFFQKPRTGDPFGIETNALVLAQRYARAASTVQFTRPFTQQVADPIINQIVDPTTKAFFQHYVQDVIGAPRDAAVAMNAKVFRFVNNRIAPWFPETAETLIKKFSDERIGEAAFNKLSSYQYKVFLGFRPLPMLRNWTQRMYAIPLVGNRRLVRGQGFLMQRNAAAREKVVASGILGPASEFINDVKGAGRFSIKLGGVERPLGRPLGGYQAMDAGNRASIYVPLSDDINTLFKSKAPFEKVAKEVNLRLYPEVVRDRFEELYRAGQVFDPRDQIANNAAHFLPDMAQLMTQFPYERGGSLEAFRAGPLRRQFGVFQTWWLMNLDYLANLTKETFNPTVARSAGERAKDIARFVEMFGTLIAVDSMMGAALGFDFNVSPFTVFPTELRGGPVAAVVTETAALISQTVKKINRELINQRENQYADHQLANAAKQVGRAAGSFVPGVQPAREITRILFTESPEKKKARKKLEGTFKFRSRFPQ